MDSICLMYWYIPHLIAFNLQQRLCHQHILFISNFWYIVTQICQFLLSHFLNYFYKVVAVMHVYFLGQLQKWPSHKWQKCFSVIFQKISYIRWKMLVKLSLLITKMLATFQKYHILFCIFTKMSLFFRFLYYHQIFVFVNLTNVLRHAGRWIIYIYI